MPVPLSDAYLHPTRGQKYAEILNFYRTNSSKKRTGVGTAFGRHTGSERGIAMLVFHQLRRLRAHGVYPPRRARSLRRFAHSPLRPHDPRFPVHNFKNCNPISIPHLSHFTSPNLLHMHQTRNCTPFVLRSLYAATDNGQLTTDHPKQTHQNRRNEPQNPLAASKSPFSTGHHAHILTKRSQTHLSSPRRPFLTLLLPCPILLGWSEAGNALFRPRAITLHKINFERSLVSWH